MDFGKVTIRGQRYEVAIESDGRFRAHCDGEWLYHETLEGLKDRLVKLTAPSKVKLSIPFYTWTREGELRHGTVIGIHGSNDNLLVRWDGEGKTEQLSSWGMPDLLRMTEAEAATFVELQDKLAELRGTIEAFTNAHKFNARLEVKAKAAEA